MQIKELYWSVNSAAQHLCNIDPDWECSSTGKKDALNAMPLLQNPREEK